MKLKTAILEGVWRETMLCNWVISASYQGGGALNNLQYVLESVDGYRPGKV